MMVVVMITMKIMINLTTMNHDEGDGIASATTQAASAAVVDRTAAVGGSYNSGNIDNTRTITNSSMIDNIMGCTVVVMPTLLLMVIWL